MTQRSWQAIPFTRARCVRLMGLAFGTAACSLVLTMGATPALAVESDSFTAIPTASQQAATEEKIEVDLLADTLAQATTDNVIASVKACSMEQRAKMLEALEPLQKERSDRAARNLYKAQSRNYDIVDFVFNAQTLEEFIQQTEYAEKAAQHNIDEIHKLQALNDEASEAKQQVASVKAEAEQALSEAGDKLKAAQDVRAAKAADAIATAQAQAVSLGGSGSVTRLLSDEEIQAAEKGESLDEKESSSSDSKSSAAKDSDSASTSSEEKSSNSSSKSSSKKEKQQTIEYSEAAMSDTAPLDDGANWYSTREEFIAEWSARIDAYFEGTPLYGQGKNFAKSAWKYCIDPRWSAAISNTESSKGKFCIRPHNAWGWGAADSDPYNLAAEWDSWEEAIDAHAKGLAKGYGYTITITGAQTYCPYTWQSWYNRTLTEMAKI